MYDVLLGSALFLEFLRKHQSNGPALNLNLPPGLLKVTVAILGKHKYSSVESWHLGVKRATWNKSTPTHLRSAWLATLNPWVPRCR